MTLTKDSLILQADAREELCPVCLNNSPKKDSKYCHTCLIKGQAGIPTYPKD